MTALNTTDTSCQQLQSGWHETLYRYMIDLAQDTGISGASSSIKPSGMPPMNEKDPFESLACNCVEVGTIIREDDTLLTIELAGVDAQTQLTQLKADASTIGSGNCKISAKTIDQGGTPVIRAMFDFDCTAEKLIFEMKHS